MTSQLYVASGWLLPLRVPSVLRTTYIVWLMKKVSCYMYILLALVQLVVECLVTLTRMWVLYNYVRTS